MLTATGRIDRVLVLGGDSDIGVATAVRLVGDRGAGQVVLAGRSPEALRDRAGQLEALGAQVDCVGLGRYRDVAGHAAGAGGGLRPPATSTSSCWPRACWATRPRSRPTPTSSCGSCTTNFTGCAAALSALGDLLRDAGPRAGGRAVDHRRDPGPAGQLRLRRVQGRTGRVRAGTRRRAGRARGARVLVVRPGFVRTAMTAGMDEAPFSLRSRGRRPGHQRHRSSTAVGSRVRPRPGPLRLVAAANAAPRAAAPPAPVRATGQPGVGLISRAGARSRGGPTPRRAPAGRRHGPRSPRS